MFLKPASGILTTAIKFNQIDRLKNIQIKGTVIHCPFVYYCNIGLIIAV